MITIQTSSAMTSIVVRVNAQQNQRNGLQNRNTKAVQSLSITSDYVGAVYEIHCAEQKQGGQGYGLCFIVANAMVQLSIIVRLLTATDTKC